MRDLYHITLDTGDAAMIPASHLQPGTRELLSPMVERLRAGEAALVGVPESLGRWRVHGAALGRCITVMLERRDSDEWQPVVWIGIAGRSRCGAVIWREMHRPIYALRTNRSRQPATPWLATRMMPGSIGLGRDKLIWIADFSECLAWCWMLSNVEE